ncbi:MULTISPECIES: hypothetical protein [unclassified Oleiphilus]|uniref:hypothetical protein n=1 Tax=unclassified Oleiphilus TaxID=2631174 RepID=UPI000B29993E|nr:MULTISPECIES: hypothetical protein [unclassified Oleiphilus]
MATHIEEVFEWPVSIFRIADRKVYDTARLAETDLSVAFFHIVTSYFYSWYQYKL